MNERFLLCTLLLTLEEGAICCNHGNRDPNNDVVLEFNLLQNMESEVT